VQVYRVTKRPGAGQRRRARNAIFSSRDHPLRRWSLCWRTRASRVNREEKDVGGSSYAIHFHRRRRRGRCSTPKRNSLGLRRTEHRHLRRRWLSNIRGRDGCLQLMAVHESGRASCAVPVDAGIALEIVTVDDEYESRTPSGRTGGRDRGNFRCLDTIAAGEARQTECHRQSIRATQSDFARKRHGAPPVSCAFAIYPDRAWGLTTGCGPWQTGILGKVQPRQLTQMGRPPSH